MVRTYIRRKDVVACDVVDDNRHRRWTCSCGAKGKLYSDSRPRYQFVGMWQLHLKRTHPEYEA